MAIIISGLGFALVGFLGSVFWYCMESILYCEGEGACYYLERIRRLAACNWVNKCMAKQHVQSCAVARLAPMAFKKLTNVGGEGFGLCNWELRGFRGFRIKVEHRTWES